VSDEQIGQALRRLYAPSETCWSPVPGVHGVLARLRDRGLRLGMLSNASDTDNVERLASTASHLWCIEHVDDCAVQRCHLHRDCA